MTRRDTPFSENVLVKELLSHFRPLQIEEYIRTSNPKDHLSHFENASLLHQYNDGVNCWVFMMTLAGSAQRWFSLLKLRCIDSFKKFNTLFLYHLASSNKHYHKTSLSLFTMK